MDTVIELNDVSLTRGETEIRHGAPEASGKICVIGSELNREAITKEFKA